MAQRGLDGAVRAGSNPQTPSDVVLVIAVGRQQQEALAELYRRHGGTLFSVAQQVLRRPEMAEEVVQDIFTRLWHRPEGFDPGRGSLRSYLAAQAHSRAVDLVRSESSRRAREKKDADGVRVAYDLEEEAMKGAMGEEVRAAMATLSDDEREAITLAYFGGHTYRDVASILGQPEGTVKSRMRSALRRLQATLIAGGIGSSGGLGLTT